MAIDIRADAARYYDLNPEVPKDLPFYRERLRSGQASVLELGCGTGRVLVPLAEHCAFIRGLDLSEAMLSICRRKLGAAGIGASRAQAVRGDITEVDLGDQYDLIYAACRVFQNLETDAEVEGFFAVVRRHLRPGGECILNVFRPKWRRTEMREQWISQGEYRCWEVPVPQGRVTCHGRNAALDPERMVLRPQLIYRRYEGNQLVDEALLDIVMRCYYPEEFEALILGHGFEVVGRWGGYQGQTYGQGPELVLAFRDQDSTRRGSG